VAKAALISAVPPLMLKTAANPGASSSTPGLADRAMESSLSTARR
jgi:hypothetical protein